MPLVVLAAVRSSPGTTTAALALAGCLPNALLVEGDPDGTVIAPRFRLGREPNVASLATATRGTVDETVLSDHAQLLPGGVPVVVGLAAPDRAVSFWRSAGPRLAASLDSVADRVVLLDAGRLSPTSPLAPLLPSAALTVLVTRPTPEELLALSHRITAIREQAEPLALLLVGDRPYAPTDVARELDIDVLGVIAHDPRSADSLAGMAAGRGLGRSPLARSAREIAGNLLDRLEVLGRGRSPAPSREEVSAL